MDGLEIKAAVEGRLPQSAQVENAQVVSWVNSAVNIICNIYPPIKTITLTDGDLPEDYLFIAEVMSQEERYLRYTVTPDRKIYFDHAGEFEVKYHYHPPRIKQIDDVIEVAEVFHGPLVEFCLSKFWEMESEGADTGSMSMAKAYEEQFYLTAAAAAETLKGGVKVTRYIRARPWTGGHK